MTEATSIRVENLFKFYGALEALHKVSFSVNPGEFLVLLGPSGAGKTTLIKILAGVEEINAGKIFFGDQMVNNLPPHLRDVAVTYETYALYSHLTVFDNMAFPLRSPVRRSNYSPAVIEERVKKWAKFLEIDNLLDRLPQHLSGGQRQRVAMGRMLVREPAIFLMDEPIAHLDAKLRHLMRAELKNIQKELMITTVYATPDQLEALSMGDRIAVINHGRVLQIGTPEEVFNDPDTEWVASFVADLPINIFKVHLQSKGNQFLIINPAFSVEIPADMAHKLEALVSDTDFDVGIRPHHILWSTEKREHYSIPAQVLSIEISGRKAVVLLLLKDLEITMKIFGSSFPHSGQTVWLYFDPYSFHFFNAKTKRRLM